MERLIMKLKLQKYLTNILPLQLKIEEYLEKRKMEHLQKITRVKWKWL